MAKSDLPDVSALFAAQERIAELNVAEAEIFLALLEESIAKCDAITDRYKDLTFWPTAIDQVINHRENLRHLHNHMSSIAGRPVVGPDAAPAALPVGA